MDESYLSSFKDIFGAAGDQAGEAVVWFLNQVGCALQCVIEVFTFLKACVASGRTIDHCVVIPISAAATRLYGSKKDE